MIDALNKKIIKINETNKNSSTENVILFLSIILSSICYGLTKNIVLFLGIASFSIIISIMKCNRRIDFAIYVALFLCTDAMGLWPSIPLFGGQFSWGDIGVVFSLLLCFLVLIKRKNYYFEKVGIVILIYLFFMLFGSIVGYTIYKQNIITGLLVFRKTYIYIAVLPLIACLQNGCVTKEKVVNNMLIFIKIYSTACAFQLLMLYCNFEITNFTYKWRWGYRLYAPIYLQMIGTYIMLYDILKHKILRKNVFWAVFFMIEIVFINQSRMAIFGLILSLLLVYIFFPTTKNKPLLLLLMGLSFTIILLIPQVREVVLTSINESMDSESGTMSYRIYERLYFDNMLEGHELFGIGIPNMNTGLAAEYSGKNVEGIYNGHYLAGAYTSDLGIYAVRYYFGYFGFSIFIIALAYALWKTFYNIVFNKKINLASCVVFGMLLFIVITCKTLNGLFEVPSQYFPLFLLSYIAKQKDTNGEVNYA